MNQKQPPYIRVEKLNANSTEPISRVVMQDAINGLECYFHHLPLEGQHFYKEANNNDVAVLFFFKGGGTITCNSSAFDVEGITLFTSGNSNDVQVSSAGKLSFIEFVLALSDIDKEWLVRQNPTLPFISTYATCKTYKEAIKSEKTINRTLLPETIVPRLCLGSVQTTGPDKVADHTHPMLEQFFFGLSGNRCTVSADGINCPFNEFDLLHIPLGSSHGVKVDAGNELHYLWVDLFKTHDFTYLKETHIESE